MNYLKNLKSIMSFVEKHKGFVFWVLIILAVLPVSLRKITDVDIWWHIHFGRVMIETFALPDLSASYFTPVTDNLADFRFTFLGDIILYLIHLVSGDVGLQFLRLGFVFLCLYLLLSITGFQYNGWTLVILMIFVVGTYQKQIIRNSLFALPLTVIFLWLFFQIRFRNRERLIWFYPPLMGLWGVLHGSYLIGFAILALLLVGDLIDSARGLNQGRPVMIYRYAVVLVLCFLSIYIKNPLTHSMFIARPVSIFASLSPPAALAKEGGQVSVKENSPVREGFFLSIKKALNNTVFKTSDAKIKSGDFVSPFDMLGYTCVPVSIGFGLIGLGALLFWGKPRRFSFMLVFSAICIFGLGYVRAVGYITIITAWVLFSIYALNVQGSGVHGSR